MMSQRGIGIIEARIGFLSNRRDLIYRDEYFSVEAQRQAPKPWSLMTSVPNLYDVPFSPSGMDGYVLITDHPGVEARSALVEDTLVALGDFSALEEAAENKRLSFFGNMGQLFEYMLLVLEKRHDIHSFHAAALYDHAENEMIILPGGSGSGKTILLLEGILRRGCQIFSTEMTHFRVSDSGLTFFKGSMFDNVRIGNLVTDFRDALDLIDSELPQVRDIWRTTVAINLERFQTESDIIEDPNVTIVFPRIEGERETVFVDTEIPKGKLRRSLFDSASEKLSKSFQMYNGNMAALPLDSAPLAAKRMSAVSSFLDYPKLKKVCTLLAGIKTCWAWREA